MAANRGFGVLGIEADPPDINDRRLSSDQTADRFIPVRSAMDWDLAHTLLVGEGRSRLSLAPMTPYQRCLQKAMYNGRCRLLAFNSRPSTTASPLPTDGVSWGDESAKQEKRHVPRIPMDAWHCRNIVDEYALNLLDWSVKNILALAIANSVRLWNYSSDSGETTSQLMELNIGYVTSVSWSPGGCQLATGLDDSTIRLWDASTCNLLRSIRGEHRRSRIGALAWNGHILTTAGNKIINYDVRANDHVFQTVAEHQGEVCALKWSASGRHLASVGADSFVYVWDLRSCAKGKWLHRFNSNSNGAKALAWCPSESNLLASSGGGDHQHVVLWNTDLGSRFCSMDLRSPVSEILWSSNGKEFLTSHGLPENQLTLWKYPSMVKLANLTYHFLPVLCISQSPDGYMVASLGADKTLVIWKDVFPKRTKKSFSEPFASFARIRSIMLSRWRRTE